MLKGKTILLVDDDDRNIFALSAVLKSKGPIIITARDGKDCLEKLKEHKSIDILLLDMMMPEMDGYQTLSEMKKDSSFNDLPVIALTALAMKGDMEKCLAAGVNDYCSKPVNIDELIVKIKTLLKL